MKVRIVVQSGIKFDETIDYAVVIKKNDQFAILKNHIPVITSINEGYIKLVSNNLESYVYILRGALKFHKNTLEVYALAAEIGQSEKQAKDVYLRGKKSDTNKVRKENVDYSKLEKDLQEHIMKSRAGSI